MPRVAGPGKVVKRKRADGREVWAIEWTDERGKWRVRQVGSNKRVAESVLRDVIDKRELAKQGIREPAMQRLRLSELLSKYLGDLRSHRSAGYASDVKASVMRLIATLGDLVAHEVRRDAVTAHRRRRITGPRKVAHRTANAEVQALSGMLNWAVSQEMIAANPLRGLKPLPEREADLKKRRRALSDSEVASFLAASQRQDQDRHARSMAERTIAGGTKGVAYSEALRLAPIPQTPLWQVMLGTGVRYAEAAALRWCDLDLTMGMLTVQAKTAKSGKDRIIPFRPELRDVLQELRRLHAVRLGNVPSPTSRIFLSPGARPLSEGSSANARKLLYKALEAAGIPREDQNGKTVDVHALRTTYGTRMAREGVTPQHLQLLMGHSNIETTMRHYVHLATSDVAAAVAATRALPAPAATPEVRRA